MFSSPTPLGPQPRDSQAYGAHPSTVHARHLPLDAPGWLRSGRLLQRAVVACALLVALQFAVTLLQPPRAEVVTLWLRTVLNWLALLVVGYVAWWSSCTRRLESPAWWLITAALLIYAIGYTTWMVENLFIHLHGAAFPTVADILFSLQYPFFFLAIILIPRRRLATPRVILTLDFLLWMGAALALSWFFMLAPIVTASDLSPLAKVGAILDPIGDLFVILGLTVALLRSPYSHRHAPVLGLLIAAFACLIVGDTWLTLIVLPPPHIYVTGAAPDAFWLTLYLGYGRCSIWVAR